MKAVARLVYSYFMSTPMTRVLTIGGIVFCVISLYVVTYLPQSQHMLAFAQAGQIAFFLGSSLMPLMVGRLARSHAGHMLPHARWKLLLSIFITVAIVALPAGILTPFAYVAGMSEPASALGGHPKLLEFTINLACVIYTSSVIIAGWLYLVMWFLSSERNAVGFAKAMLVVVLIVFLPAREIRDLSATTRWNLEQLALAWTVFGALFLAWPRLRKAWAARTRSERSSRGSFSRGTTGREIDLILGTGNPWMLIAAQLIPIVIASRVGVRLPAVWLYFLTIFSTVTGAVAGQAAERSRALWLRTGCSRAELFSEVERSFLRHNGIVLGLLLVLMSFIGIQMGYGVVLLAAGLPLLALGTVVSTYLGLLITRGLRWPESVLAIALMIVLMTVPLMLENPDANLPAVIGIEVCLAVLAIVLRTVAARRWAEIDWTQCRPTRAISVRGV